MLMRMGLEKGDIEIPLTLTNENIVREDRSSWQWMVNQYGIIEISKKVNIHAGTIIAGHYESKEYAGQQELRYTEHPHLPDPDRHYQSEKHDPMKYMGGCAGLRMYDPLNFHDEAMFMYNT